MKERCNGTLNEITSSCCSNKNPCSKGKGDCDSDSDCKGNLICGIDNCHTEFPHDRSHRNLYDDCCTGNENNLNYQNSCS